MNQVAFFYATFPRPTETFVRRELRAFAQIGFDPDLYSIWKGRSEWEGKKILKFQFFRLLYLFFWIPYWAWLKPQVFKEILVELWAKPCPNLQNWNETFLALGFALVEAHNFKNKKYSLLHGIWATMPATAALALSKLTNTPFSMGAHAYDVFRTGGDWLLQHKFENALFIRTSSQSTARRIEQLGVPCKKIKLIRRGLANWPVRSNFELVNESRLELLSVGRLVEKKGYIYQLKIAVELLFTSGTVSPSNYWLRTVGKVSCKGNKSSWNRRSCIIRREQVSERNEKGFPGVGYFSFYWCCCKKWRSRWHTECDSGSNVNWVFNFSFL